MRGYENRRHPQEVPSYAHMDTKERRCHPGWHVLLGSVDCRLSTRLLSLWRGLRCWALGGALSKLRPGSAAHTRKSVGHKPVTEPGEGQVCGGVRRSFPVGRLLGEAWRAPASRQAGLPPRQAP